jgi:1,2-diacylglycerol 3-alpha-glucosyltransferase
VYFSRAAEMRASATPSSLPGLGDPRPFFLASARFITRKNLIGLVNAFAKYRTKVPNPWRLVLLGDGEQRPEIESRIGALGLGDEVTLAGFCSMEETLSYYARAKVLVHASLADQWGLVVNEAMAAGLPVIVSNQSGCAEDLVVHGENGFRFNAEDEEVLAELLGRISGPGVDLDRMGRRSEEIVADWGPDRFAGELRRAIEAGRETSGRRPDLAGRLVLALLDRLARSVRSFHTVEA